MNGSPHLNNHLPSWRIFIVFGVICLVFMIYVGRLFSLQIIEGDEWTARAQENSLEEYNLPAMRGIIYDRNGTILARNVPAYNVVITAANLPDDDGTTQQIFRELSALIGVPVSQGELSPETPYVPCISDHGIMQIVEYGESSTPYQPVDIKCDVNETTAMIIQEKSTDWPGVSIETQAIRDYPTGSATASIVGFLGPIPSELENYYREQGLVPNRDKVGYAGLEMQYQDLLAGKNGLQIAKIDVAGDTVLENVEPPVNPEPGMNLELTIDTRLQIATEAILKQEMKEWNDYFGRTEYNSGVVIAMNPQTGEILSMVSYPSYENNRMARQIPGYYYEQLVEDPLNPLLNHAVGDVLPVGSVFKLVTAVGGLNEGVVDVDQIIDTPGKLVVGEKFYENDERGITREFVDWIYKSNPGGFGQLDFVHALANSSNVYFYKVGGGFEDEIPEGLGICRLGTYARAIGYGEDPPGIYLPDEEGGLIPSPEWKRVNQWESWSTGDTYISSVGQGYVLGTPLQVLLSAATVANGGKLMQPSLIREVVDGEGNVVNLYIDEEGNVTTTPTDHQISPFVPYEKWDMTSDNVIQLYGDTSLRGCEPIEGSFTNVQPWVMDKVREGMRLAVTEGTLSNEVSIGFQQLDIPAAGKTGTAEYCDTYMNQKGRCSYGNWPTHAWTVSFAPYEDPEIAVVAFVYNGGEGSTVAGPIVRQVIQSYFELKTIDAENQSPE